jgi:2-succinyl-6-hydroxy-2,4-cyclohexadiene-1-carboxylate synthase
VTVLALHGFLGRGSDWDAVRAASRPAVPWVCPDLFAPGAGEGFRPPPVGGKAWLAGYSFGARLALRMLAEQPERWHGALLVSVDPGNFQDAPARAERRAADARWAHAFREEPWDAVLHRWNFDRAKLAAALEDFSVADQFTDAAQLPGRLVWLAGGKDRKFAGLLESMRAAGFPGEFFSVPGAGHRLLHEAPEAVAAALDRLTA